MKLSLVVICHNSLPLLKTLLESLPGALADITYETIIVDNGSSDRTRDFLAECGDRYRTLFLDRNFGVAVARNRGIEYARGEYVWILDDDTVVTPEAARTLVAYLDSHPDCGVCACALADSSGEIQESYKPYPGLLIKIRNLLGLKRRSPYAALFQKGEPFEPEYVIGACQMIRREVFATVGMLDSHIFYGPEDADFCIRARKQKWRIAYLPGAVMTHKWRRTTSRRPFSRMGLRHTLSLLYFYAKHRRI